MATAEDSSLIFLMKNLTNLCKIFPIVIACLRYFFYLKHLHLIKLWL